MSPMATIGEQEPATHGDKWKERIGELPLVKFEVEVCYGKMTCFKSMLTSRYIIYSLIICSLIIH